MGLKSKAPRGLRSLSSIQKGLGPMFYVFLDFKRKKYRLTKKFDKKEA